MTWIQWIVTLVAGLTSKRRSSNEVWGWSLLVAELYGFGAAILIIGTWLYRP